MTLKKCLSQQKFFHYKCHLSNFLHNKSSAKEKHATIARVSSICLWEELQFESQGNGLTRKCAFYSTQNDIERSKSYAIQNGATSPTLMGTEVAESDTVGIDAFNSKHSEFFLQFLSLLKENDQSLDTIGQMPLSIRTTFLRQAMWRCSENMYISPNERSLLKKSLLVSEGQLQSYLKLARVEKRKGRPVRMISEETKEIIRNWLEENDYRMPNASEKKELLQRSGLGNKQLLDQLTYLRLKPGKITESTKMTIREWLSDNNYRLPSREEREVLQEKTGLSYHQLNNQIHYLKEASDSISHTAKRYIESWLEEHSYRSPTPDEKLAIRAETGITRKQLDTQLVKILEKTNTEAENSKEILLSWLKEHDYRSPTSEERRFLQSQTGMGRHRLNCSLQRLREQPGELTRSVIGILETWMKENNFRNPNKYEKEDLLLRTGLSRSQLYHQIRKISDSAVSISHIEKARQYIREWVENHTARPSREEITHLLNETQISENQLKQILKGLREQNGQVTQESKAIVKTWLYDNDFRTRLTAKEKFDLLQMTGWNSNQLKAQLRILTESQGEITPKSQAFLKQWLERNQYRTPNQAERKEILKETQWNASQLRHQLRQALNPKGEITETSKAVLRQWLIKHNFKSPTPQEKEALLETTGWNSKQLHDQIRRMS